GLEAWHAYYEGQAAFYARDYERAARAFESSVALAPSSLRARAQARLGEALIAAEQPAAAAPALEEAARTASTVELLHHRARARDAADNSGGAREDRIRLAVRFPAHAYGEAAAATLLSSAPPYRFTFEQRRARAEAFLDAGEGARALDEAAAIAREKLGRAPPARAQMAWIRARALFQLRRPAEAEQELNRALKGPLDIAAPAAMFRAKRVLKSADRTAAREAMTEVAQRFPSRPEGDEAHFYVGWLDLQRGAYEDAVKSFTDFVRRRPASRRIDEVLWFKALAQLRLEDYGAARATLEELTRQVPGSPLVPQARYWIARAGQLGGEGGEVAAPAYEELIRLFPASFYAFLAHARLSDLGRAPPPPFPDPPSARAEKPPPQLERAVLLAQAGLLRDAALEIDAQLASVRGAAEAVRFGHALQQLGEYGPAHALASRHLWGAAFGEKRSDAVALFYPRAFQAAVEKESRAQKVPASLLWSIMRRESGFRPEVASSADARGLMQIIPPTATAIARAVGDAAPPPDSLFAPEINIRYGAWYLAKLLERFGHPALAAAAYNAGPAVVAEWINSGGQVPLDLFVELIPYRETRGYVKQVIADYHLYETLYGVAKADAVALTLPRPASDGVAF
ncbi:MAG TPA: transglycosylase SLT domain-containing protein, partial [Myxococcaceae bacterium]|nr:transglycosylase SLT domain-containing protein [Myxococcaceae bacterium]